jgi:hypothetical protein
LLHSSGSRSLVEATEQFADGIFTRVEWEEAAIQVALKQELCDDARRSPTHRAAFAAAQLLSSAAYDAAGYASFHTCAAMQLAEGPEAPDWFFDPFRMPPFGARIPKRHPEQATQAALLRCIVGNPYCPKTINESWQHWNGGTVRALAQAIYTERGYDRMPMLADALEDAGCRDCHILDHCRGPGPHARGCWVVDLLLGKS